MAELQPIIIKKKKVAGHGHHGGAWKVAYADFVTAMMAFFMVMWLLGADEETKTEIEEYFKNPSQPWRVDLQNSERVPLGNRQGTGDQMLSGEAGDVPEELVQTPANEMIQEVGTVDFEEVDAEANRVPDLELNIEILKFTIKEDHLFEKGSIELASKAERELIRLAKLVRSFRGKVTVKAFTEPTPKLGSNGGDPYEFTLARSVAVVDYLIKNRLVDAHRAKSRVVNGIRRSPASDADPYLRNVRKIEITFLK